MFPYGYLLFSFGVRSPLEFGTRLLNLTFLTIPSEASNQNQASPRPDSYRDRASPKKQDNRRRLRLRAAQNLSFMRFRNSSPNSVDFFIELRSLIKGSISATKVNQAY